MKYLLITIFFSVLFISCDKEDAFVPIYEPGSMEYGFATAKKNGLEFIASGYGRKNATQRSDSLFSIYLSTESSDGHLREGIVFGHFGLLATDYNIRKGNYDYADPGRVACFYDISEDDGDVLEEIYWVDTTYQNRISIEEVDSSTWLVKGSFDLSFNVQQPKRKHYNPDNVKFTQGRFEIRIRD